MMRSVFQPSALGFNRLVSKAKKKRATTRIGLGLFSRDSVNLVFESEILS